VNSNSQFAEQLRQLTGYVNRQWVEKTSVGPSRLTVRDNRSRTNNVVESYQSAMSRRVKVSHPNFFTFLGHLQRATTDCMNDMARVSNGLNIRRPKKTNILNELRIKTCLDRFDSGRYSRMQFLKAVSHSVGAHTDTLHGSSSDTSGSDDDDDNDDVPSTSAPTTSSVNPTNNDADTTIDYCEVCTVASRSTVALVPCGHARFCRSCTDTLVAMGSACPICRTRIDMVLRLFN
jgi:hypothetical protein